MNMTFLYFMLIVLFCCVCSFFFGIDLGRELQQKEQDKVLKEIRNKGYNINT